MNRGKLNEHSDPRSEALVSLDCAEKTAKRTGLPGFDAWRTTLERRYTVMPLWYWNDRACRQQYAAHVRRAAEWQLREHRINAANTGFQLSLSRSCEDRMA